jgi:hypothetical protein
MEHSTFDPKSENLVPMAARRSPKTSLNLRKALGASEETSRQLLSLYIPDKDRDGREFGAQRKWIREAAKILSVIGGGVTIMPAVEGGWLNAEGKTIWEHPVVVYTYVKPGPFLEEPAPVSPSSRARHGSRRGRRGIRRPFLPHHEV